MDMLGGMQKGHMITHVHAADSHEYHQSVDHVHGDSLHGHDSVGGHPDGMTMKGHNMMAGMDKMSNMGSMNMLPATFALTTDSDFLFEGLKISTVPGIAVAMVATIVITIVIDSLKFMIHIREVRRGKSPNVENKSNLGQFVTTIFHMVSMTLAYIMMLCVMTMNVWLIVSVVLGSGIAHLLMRPLLASKLGQPQNIPDHKTNPAALEERKPLSDHCVSDNSIEHDDSKHSLINTGTERSESVI